MVTWERGVVMVAVVVMVVVVVVVVEFTVVIRSKLYKGGGLP